MAAIGIVQLERFPLLSVKRQDIYKIYNSIFHNHNQIKSIELDIENVIPHIYVVRIKGLKNRELLQKKMLELGIQTGYHYQPNHLLDFYRVRNENTLLVTDAIFPELLSLPLHPDLTKSDVHKVANSLIQLIANENF
jgi:dTDP-4-amino-4,6-dideoxygalactose transaminase